MISIGTNNNAVKTSVPEGKNNPNIFKPCILKPKIFIPIKKEKLKAMVTMI